MPKFDNPTIKQTTKLCRIIKIALSFLHIFCNNAVTYQVIYKLHSRKIYIHTFW